MGLFGRRAAVGYAPNSPEGALNGKLRTFVNAYVQARNSGGNSTSGNAAIAAALKAYINVKRPAAAGTAAGAAAAAGAGPAGQQAAAAAVGVPLAPPVPVNVPIPSPQGLAGAVLGVKRGANQNNNASRANLNYIAQIVKNNKYTGNSNRVKAVLDFNPSLKKNNYTAMMNKTNNANVKRLLKLLANVPNAAKPNAATPAVNAVPNTGEALSTMFANRTALNAVLAKTENQQLQSNINNRNKASALMKELKNAAAAAGVNLKNMKVNAAINRIMRHESRLPVKPGATGSNRSRLNAVLAKANSQKLQSNITTRNQANALAQELRNAAAAAGVNLKNKNVNAALTRIVNHQSRLPVSGGGGPAAPQAQPNSDNSKINTAIRNKNFGTLNTVNLITKAANKVKNSNAAVKNAYVNYVTRQIGTYNSNENKRKLKAARNLVKPPGGAASQTPQIPSNENLGTSNLFQPEN